MFFTLLCLQAKYIVTEVKGGTCTLRLCVQRLRDADTHLRLILLLFISQNLIYQQLLWRWNVSHRSYREATWTGSGTCQRPGGTIGRLPHWRPLSETKRNRKSVSRLGQLMAWLALIGSFLFVLNPSDSGLIIMVNFLENGEWNVSFSRGYMRKPD